MSDFQQQIWDLNAQENLKQLGDEKVSYIYQLISQAIPEIMQYFQQKQTQKQTSKAQTNNASKGLYIKQDTFNGSPVYQNNQAPKFNLNFDIGENFSQNLMNRLNLPKLNVPSNPLTNTSSSVNASSTPITSASSNLNTSNVNINQSPLNNQLFEHSFGKTTSSNPNGSPKNNTFATTLQNIGTNLLSSGAGMAAGYLVGQGGQKIFGDSKAGQMATGLLSQAAGTVASSGVTSALGNTTFGTALGNSVGSAAGLANIGAGVANLALDVFDPVVKSKAEIYGGLGAGLAAGLLNPFAGLTALGANAIGHLTSKKGNTFTIDTDTLKKVGPDHADTTQDIYKAGSLSGLNYSGYNGSKRKDDNRFKDKIRSKQHVMNEVADDATSDFLIKNTMAAINSNRRALNMQGDYDYQSTRVGKHGLKLDYIKRTKNILSNYKKQQTNQLQQGGSIDSFEYYLKSLPQNQRDSTNFRVKDYWIFNGKPKDFKEACRRGMFTYETDGWHASTIAWNPKTGEGEFMKSPNHPSVQKEIDWYNSDNGSDFRSEYELVKSSPYWKYVKRQRKEVPLHKDGGSINTNVIEETSIELIDPKTLIEETSIELIIPEEIPEFQNGGSMNVIPDGALHARKHNMEMEGITKKGIPVVSEEKDGQIEQQAEIEKEEIIFRLEITQKLEELEKKFYSDESTQEEKDEYALEAGKLLVNEILYNTQDNTGLLNKI